MGHEKLIFHKSIICWLCKTCMKTFTKQTCNIILIPSSIEPIKRASHTFEAYTFQVLQLSFYHTGYRCSRNKKRRPFAEAADFLPSDYYQGSPLLRDIIWDECIDKLSCPLYQVYVITYPCDVPYHIMPYHAMSCHIMPCHAMPYHTKPCHSIPYHTIPYRSRLYHVITYHTIPYCSTCSKDRYSVCISSGFRAWVG